MGEDRLITTADGRHLRAMVRGSGPNLVVLDAGLAANGFCWGTVQKLIADQLPDAQIVAYNRAGMGGSDPDPQPRTLARMSDDLDDVINSFVPQKVFLVGHSWGGTLALFNAARRVAHGRPIDGIVLVDHSAEDADLYSNKIVKMVCAVTPIALRLLDKLKIAKWVLGAMGDGLPKPIRAAAIAGSSSTDALNESAAEADVFVSELEWLRTQPLPLDGVDVCVITGMKVPTLLAKFRQPLVESHQRLARNVRTGRWVPATKSAHTIPATEPELIANQAAEMVIRAQ